MSIQNENVSMKIMILPQDTINGMGFDNQTIPSANPKCLHCWTTCGSFTQLINKQEYHKITIVSLSFLEVFDVFVG